MSNTSNNTISEEEAQNIFIKICEKNQWSILVRPLKYETDYVLKKSSSLEDTDLPFVASLQDIAKKITFFKNNPLDSFHLRLSHEDTFEFVAGFLEAGNLKTVKKLAFFQNYIARKSSNSPSSPEEAGFKNWADVLNLVNYSSNMRDSSFKILMTKFHGKFTPREFINIFNIIKEKNYNKHEFHEMISSFCGNHLNQILGKQRLTSYLMAFIKDKCPEQSSFYTTLLNCKDENVEMMFSAKDTYQVFHLDKKIMMNRYTLNFAKIPTEKDYEDILQHAILFMNKNADKLNIRSVLLTGQAKDPFFTITVGTTPEFDIDVLKRMFSEVLQQAVVVNRKVNDDGKSLNYATGIKQENAKYYKILLSQITLEKGLPEKKDIIFKSNKI